MKKIFLIALVVLSSTPCVLAQNYDSSGSDSVNYEWVDSDRPYEVTLGLSSGYRHDKVVFNISGDLRGQNPNILSELTWDEIKSLQIRGQGQVYFKATKMVVEASAAYSSIYSGENQDSDYDGDNRTLEDSRSNNSSDEGNMLDFSTGLGYRFALNEYFENISIDRFYLTPLLGLSYNAQNLQMQDGFQTIPATGPFAGLDSEYNTKWYGAWLGVELSGQVAKLTGAFRVEYHLMRYYADADWNLRSDFMHPKSFEHEADAHGIFLRAGVGYQLTDSWQINVGLNYYTYKTEQGIDRTFFSSGATVETRLNEVLWDSYSVDVGLKYSWL